MEIAISYSYGPLQGKDKVIALERALRDLPESLSVEEMTEKYTEHLFGPGVYVRTMKVSAGMCVVGKTHREACVNILVSGTMRVVSEFGEETVTGPRTWLGEPGIKRAGYAITDVEWINIHPNPTDTQDLKEIESRVIVPERPELTDNKTHELGRE